LDKQISTCFPFIHNQLSTSSCFLKSINKLLQT